MIIEDGTGDGKNAKVTKDKELVTLAHVVDLNHVVNHEKEESFVFYSDVTAAGAGNAIAYIKNTHTDKDMVINWYRAWSGTDAEAFDVIFSPTGTASGDTIIPSNMTVGSGVLAQGIFLEGTGITGLSGGTQMDRIRLAGNGEDAIANWPGDIILPKNAAISIQAVNGSIATEISLSFYYSAKE